MQHGQKMQDEEIKDAIRRRLDDGLPCGVVALRQALGGRGGTDRLMALIEEVRGERRGIGEVGGLFAGGSEEALPREVARLLDQVAHTVTVAVQRVRAEERTTAAALIEQAQHAAQTRIESAAEESRETLRDAADLARAHDELVAQADALEAVRAELEHRLSQSEARVAEQADHVASVRRELAGFGELLEGERRTSESLREQCAGASARSLQLEQELAECKAAAAELRDNAAVQSIKIDVLTSEA
jgi:chromosome segregation ATPase